MQHPLLQKITCTEHRLGDAVQHHQETYQTVNNIKTLFHINTHSNANISTQKPVYQ